MIQRIINRVFRLEEINGGRMCPTYMFRWTLLATPWFKVYLHHFVGDDWSRDRHDHPKSFMSIGLAGAYIEETAYGSELFRAPWIRRFPAEHIHRIRLTPDRRGAWTIAIVGRWQRDWGFWHGSRWVRWDRYVGSSEAELMKDC